jgi:hypothetical protein
MAPEQGGARNTRSTVSHILHLDSRKRLPQPDPTQATLILALNTYLLARVYAEGFHSLRDDGGLLASVTALATLSYLTHLTSFLEVVL